MAATALVNCLRAGLIFDHSALGTRGRGGPQGGTHTSGPAALVPWHGMQCVLLAWSAFYPQRVLSMRGIPGCSCVRMLHLMTVHL